MQLSPICPRMPPHHPARFRNALPPSSNTGPRRDGRAEGPASGQGDKGISCSAKPVESLAERTVQEGFGVSQSCRMKEVSAMWSCLWRKESVLGEAAYERRSQICMRERSVKEGMWSLLIKNWWGSQLKVWWWYQPCLSWYNCNTTPLTLPVSVCILTERWVYLREDTGVSCFLIIYLRS